MNVTKVTSLLAALMLAGCEYEALLSPRDGGAIGKGVVDSRAKSVTVSMDSTTYQGNYVIDEGKSITTAGRSNGNAVAYDAYGNAVYASGDSYGNSVTSVEGSGVGRAVLVSEAGSLRCEFVAKGNNGVGTCIHADGRVFDLLVRKK